MADFDYREQSEFNDALGLLNRINSALFWANASSVDIDVYGWFRALEIVKRELSALMKPAEKEQCQHYKEAINARIYAKKGDMMVAGFKSVDPVLYDMLDNYDMYLRDIYKKTGMMTKLGSDPGKALI